MKILNKKVILCCVAVFLSCVVMGIVDAVVKPGYAVKSMIKIALFLAVPAVYSLFDKNCDIWQLFNFKKRGVIEALAFGGAVFVAILLGYFVFKNVFDFSQITGALTGDAGVNKNNFIYVSMYIALVNSLLEEFFFRGFTFFQLKRIANRDFAYIFSAFVFALYHVAMMVGWFSIWLLLVVILGLFVGGVLFNYLNEKHENICVSWLVHMFANVAINLVGMILFGII